MTTLFIVLFVYRTMHDITSLGNKQLSFYHETIDHKLNNIQIEIVEDIADLLGQTPSISHETYTDTEKFNRYCEKYRPSIEQEKKDLFLILMKQKKEITEEIHKRQVKMLEEIGIFTPSTRVMMIMEQTQGTNFQCFDDLIRYIKLARADKANRRPKEKKIHAPQRLIEIFDNL